VDFSGEGRKVAAEAARLPRRQGEQGKMRKFMLAGIAGAAALAAQAAAQQAAGPAQAPTTIVYSDEGMSRMADLPMGVHRIPDSNIIISGHQKGGGLGLLFGPLGMAIQSSANASGGTARVSDVRESLRFDATAKAAELTSAILAADDQHRQRFSLSAAGGGTLNVTPYVVITYVNETEVRPFVVLKTKLYTPTDKSPKAIKYFCCEGRPLPLSGPNGLAENGGEGLKALLAAELETAIRVMLQDRSRPYPRDKQSRITVKGNFPFVAKPLKMKGYNLGIFGDYALIDFGTGALTFGGVNIAEPGSLEVVPAK
jgi:hypothetical protein